jgi:hypothetical protein
MRIKSPKSIVNRPKPKKSARPSSLPRQSHQNKLGNLKRERRKLRAAENVTKDPLKGHLKQRGQLVGRRIANIQNEKKNNQ